MKIYFSPDRQFNTHIHAYIWRRTWNFKSFSRWWIHSKKSIQLPYSKWSFQICICSVSISYFGWFQIHYLFNFVRNSIGVANICDAMFDHSCWHCPMHTNACVVVLQLLQPSHSKVCRFSFCSYLWHSTVQFSNSS